MEEGISRTHLDADPGERFVPLRRRLGVTTFGLNQVVLQPGQRGRIHRHERQEEVYLVLEGELTLIVEGDEHLLGEGDLMRVAPLLRRQLVNAAETRVVLLAVGGSEPHAGRDGEAFSAWHQEHGAPPLEIPLPADLPVE